MTSVRCKALILPGCLKNSTDSKLLITAPLCINELIALYSVVKSEESPMKSPGMLQNKVMLSKMTNQVNKIPVTTRSTEEFFPERCHMRAQVQSQTDPDSHSSAAASHPVKQDDDAGAFLIRSVRPGP